MAISQVQVDTYTVAGDGTLSFNVTNPGGGTVMLLVAIGYDNSFSDNISGETYDGAAGTLVTARQSANRKLRVTRFESPAAGTKAIAFAASAANANTPIVVHACWFTGVDQTTPVVGPDTSVVDTGTGTTPSHTMSPGSDERLFMATMSDGGPIFPAAATNVEEIAATNDYQPGTLDISFGTHWTTLDGYATVALQSSLGGNWVSTAMVLNAAVGGVEGAGSSGFNYSRRRRMAT